MSDWVNIPKNIEEYQGFVYMTVHKRTGMYYIGKKNFWRIKKLKPLKGKKRKRHFKVQSDWKDYYGSSKSLTEDIEKYGKEEFGRVMIELCYDKWSMSYKELEYQMINEVLTDKNSYNGIINVRLRARK